MTTQAIEIQGTLREDGTLLLDQKPNLPPGRVRVMVQPANAVEAVANDAVTVLDQIHAAQALRGHVPRSVEEIDAYHADMRDTGEREKLIEQIQEECHQHREQQKRTTE
jgi:hypothetical protein